MIDINAVLKSYEKLGFLCGYEAVAKDLECTVREVQQALIDCMNNNLDETFLSKFVYGIWSTSKNSQDKKDEIQKG